MKKILSSLTAILLSVTILAGCAGGGQNDDASTIVLLSGAFTEIEVLMQMAGMLIEEHTDLNITWQDSMHTVPAANALIDNHVDLYVGYDGTLLTTIMGYDPSDVPPGTLLFDWVNERALEVNGLHLLGKFGFQNTYALAVKQDFAQANNIRTISDLVPFGPELVFGAEHEFFDPVGTMRFIPFNDHYNFEWRSYNAMDIALKYAAMDAGHIDVTMVYSSDGLNRASDLYVLLDDLMFFPEYNVSFQHRATLFEEFSQSAPNLREVLNMLTGIIDIEMMIEMNYRVDALGENVVDVAREFLVENGLL